MPHLHMFSYSGGGGRGIIFNFPKMMHLLSFYFYFVKNAYLCFISYIYPLYQFQGLFIGKTSF